MSAAVGPVSSAAVRPSRFSISTRSFETYGRKSRFARLFGISASMASSAQSEVTQHSIKSTGISLYSRAIMSREIAGDLPPKNATSARTTRRGHDRSEAHKSELQSLRRTSYDVFCLTKTHYNTKK